MSVCDNQRSWLETETDKDTVWLGKSGNRSAAHESRKDFRRICILLPPLLLLLVLLVNLLGNSPEFPAAHFGQR